MCTDVRPCRLIVAAVLAVLLAAAPGTALAGEEAKGDPYLLDTCAYSGQKLGSMGDPVVRVIDGREFRFCCAGCINPFQADFAARVAKIDEQLIEKQQKHYPLTTCLVRGVELEDGASVDIVHNNRLVRFCCNGCAGRFKENPEEYLTKLDEAVIEKQKPVYTATTCPVMEENELGSHGEPVDIVIGNRLVRLCCAGCEDDVRAEPLKYLAAAEGESAESGA